MNTVLTTCWILSKFKRPPFWAAFCLATLSFTESFAHEFLPVHLFPALWRWSFFPFIEFILPLLTDHAFKRLLPLAANIMFAFLCVWVYSSPLPVVFVVFEEHIYACLSVWVSLSPPLSVLSWPVFAGTGKGMVVNMELLNVCVWGGVWMFVWAWVRGSMDVGLCLNWRDRMRIVIVKYLCILCGPTFIMCVIVFLLILFILKCINL